MFVAECTYSERTLLLMSYIPQFFLGVEVDQSLRALQLAGFSVFGARTVDDVSQGLRFSPRADNKKSARGGGAAGGREVSSTSLPGETPVGTPPDEDSPRSLTRSIFSRRFENSLIICLWLSDEIPADVVEESL